jgi:hypothetical protein
MTLHRCELAEALLHSPVKIALHETELIALHELLALDSNAAMNERCLPEQMRGRWPTARIPAGLSASIAAWAWPRFCAQHINRLEAAVAEALFGVQRAQLVGPRSGHLLLRRDTGEAEGRVGVRLLTLAAGVPPEWTAVDLSRVWTAEMVRGRLLGPLAAWPVDTDLTRLAP